MATINPDSLRRISSLLDLAAKNHADALHFLIAAQRHLSAAREMLGNMRQAVALRRRVRTQKRVRR